MLRNGLINGNDYIEKISQGLTGLQITLLGMLLASLGILKGSIGGKKKDKYEESIGITKPYSIRAGNRNVDISWMSPSAIPLLIGSELYTLLNDENYSWENVDDVLQALEKMLNPISEMTMLKNVDEVVTNYGSNESSISGIGGAIDTALKSYIGQAFPTLGYQINKVIDPTIRSTAISKNTGFKFLESVTRQNANKIPGMSYLLEPSIDIWGNVKKRSDNTVLRALDSFVNPANVTKDTSTEVDHEIIRLYETNDSTDVIPKTPQKYFTAKSVEYEMSAKEYTQYKMTYGQTSYENLETLFLSDYYKAMTDEEKGKAVKKVYDEAEQKAKLEFMTNRYGEDGISMLLDDKNINKLNKAQEELGITTNQYFRAYYGRTVYGTKKADEMKAIQELLPTLSSKDVERLYKIYSGNL